MTNNLKKTTSAMMLLEILAYSIGSVFILYILEHTTFEMKVGAFASAAILVGIKMIKTHPVVSTIAILASACIILQLMLAR